MGLPVLNELRAELRALKAMYYFYLVDMYGRVPIVTRSGIPSDSLTLAERKEVWQYAVDELQQTMPLLSREKSQIPENEYYGRMTYFVATFVLMKLYLNHVVYTGDENPALYDSIADYADMLSNYYTLEENLQDNTSA